MPVLFRRGLFRPVLYLRQPKFDGDLLCKIISEEEEDFLKHENEQMKTQEDSLENSRFHNYEDEIDDSDNVDESVKSNQ